jgi:hypothetical protein
MRKWKEALLTLNAQLVMIGTPYLTLKECSVEISNSSARIVVPTTTLEQKTAKVC